MEAVRDGKDEWRVPMTPADAVRLGAILNELGTFARLPPIDHYRSMTAAEIWLALVCQICVMGASRGVDRIMRDPARKAAFFEAIKPDELRNTRRPADRLARALREFKATRFPQKNARLLIPMLKNPDVFVGGRCVLHDGLGGTRPASIRAALIERTRLFKLKSAPDFMITTGLSDDVIAIDVRAANALRKLFGLKLTAPKIQRRPALYDAIEASLRAACAGHGKPLAMLDRVLFQFSAMSALEFVAQRSTSKHFVSEA